MAKLPSRTALTSLADGDLLHVVDVSDLTDDITGSSKKITAVNIGLYNDARAKTLTNTTLTTPQLNGVWYAFSSKVADYTATATDTYINVDATLGAVVVTLPTAIGNTGLEINVKKTDGSVNTVTIDGNGLETIDGALTKVISVQYTAYTFVSNGLGWSVF